MRNKLNLLITVSALAVISFFSLRPVSIGTVAGTSLFTPLHFLAYFSLAGSFLLHFHDNRIGHVYAVLAAFGFGVIMELVQTQVPSRVFSYSDMAVNLIGASLVLLDHRSQKITEIIRLEDQFLEKIENQVI